MAISRDRAIVVASLVAIAGLAWAYLFGLSQDMASMDDMPGMAMSSTLAPFHLTATMWAVMMVGMMLPSAMPMILLFTTVQRKQGKRPVITTGTFAAGYLLVWGGFAVAAAALQIQLGKLALL
jgi:predicted metal-binding membrane protein